MTFEDAVQSCPVRGAIYLPDGKRYFKNYPQTLEEQVPKELQKSLGWAIFDPRDEDDCSLFMFND